MTKLTKTFHATDKQTNKNSTRNAITLQVKPIIRNKATKPDASTVRVINENLFTLNVLFTVVFRLNLFVFREKRFHIAEKCVKHFNFIFHILLLSPPRARWYLFMLSRWLRRKVQSESDLQWRRFFFFFFREWFCNFAVELEKVPLNLTRSLSQWLSTCDVFFL